MTNSGMTKFGRTTSHHFFLPFWSRLRNLSTSIFSHPISYSSDPPPPRTLIVGVTKQYDLTHLWGSHRSHRGCAISTATKAFPFSQPPPMEVLINRNPWTSFLLSPLFKTPPHSQGGGGGRVGGQTPPQRPGRGFRRQVPEYNNIIILNNAKFYIIQYYIILYNVI